MLRQDIAIIQFDTRELTDYWAVSVRWNRAYADKHGHAYKYFSLKDKKCTYEHLSLSPAWCKVNITISSYTIHTVSHNSSKQVRAMLEAPVVIPTAKAFLYLDTDVIITSNYSMVSSLTLYTTSMSTRGLQQV